jgi:hypothetical protein
VFIDAVTLRRLYIDEMLTTAEVARHFKCGPSTVRRQLVRFGIPARRRGPAPGRLRVARGAPFGGWSADVAYVVGLIATDGNLGRKNAAISIVSNDTDLLETVKPHINRLGEPRFHRLATGDRCSTHRAERVNYRQAQRRS